MTNAKPIPGSQSQTKGKRPCTAAQFTHAQRCHIEALAATCATRAAIARRLGVHQSTISRKLAHNRTRTACAATMPKCGLFAHANPQHNSLDPVHRAAEDCSLRQAVRTARLWGQSNPRQNELTPAQRNKLKFARRCTAKRRQHGKLTKEVGRLPGGSGSSATGWAGRHSLFGLGPHP